MLPITGRAAGEGATAAAHGGWCVLLPFPQDAGNQSWKMDVVLSHNTVQIAVSRSHSAVTSRIACRMLSRSAKKERSPLLY